MDICNNFIGCSKFLGVYPVLYDSKIMDAPFRKAKFFLTRHIVFIILTIFALITKYIRYSNFESKLNEEHKSLLLKTYGVFNMEFILHSNKSLSILGTVVPLMNFTFKDTLTLLNTCAKCTFPCREASSGFIFLKWALFPVMVIANIQDIGFEVYSIFQNWSKEQLLDSFTSLLRTITGFTPFFATMFLFVCMFSTKEKIKHIRGELKNIAFILESREGSRKTTFLPDVEDVFMPSQLHVKQFLTTLHLKLKALREQHNDLIFSSQSLNKRFQTDLLFMIVVTFYLLLICTYGLVFNINNFDNKRGFGLINFFILTLTIIVYRLFLCWVVCHGASSIDVESKLLEMAIMKLSLSNIKGKRSQLEIQLFHLQCKNRENPFNIFGMFAIGKSFMFMMLTTIISYIAVIIQFTYEAQAGLNGTSISNKTNSSGIGTNTTNNTEALFGH